MNKQLIQDNHGILAVFINAFSRFAAVRTLVSSFYACTLFVYLPFSSPHCSSFSFFHFFLFLSFFLSLFHVACASSSLSFILSFSLTFCLSIRVSICLYCSVHVLSVCVYVRRAALNNMYYGREWMEL